MRTFIGGIKGWHAAVVAALALIYAAVMYFAGSETPGSSENAQFLFHSAIALPVMLFVMAFLIFACTTEKFGALALFPSILVTLLLFLGVALVGYSLNYRDFSYPIPSVLGLVVCITMSALICGMIAIKQKLSR